MEKTVWLHVATKTPRTRMTTKIIITATLMMADGIIAHPLRGSIGIISSVKQCAATMENLTTGATMLETPGTTVACQHL